MSAEGDRVAAFGHLEDGLRTAGEWYWWGPYVSERQWGTVREDYSADGDAWNYLPHDHARSRAYRWGEDGMAGFSDIEQRLCLGVALWNGRDPILKERMFGLNGSEANHGEDVKEYWWYLDALPSHAFNRWRYHYPQGAYPYEDLHAENGRRSRTQPEYELLDTGIFDEDRYWVVDVVYAKADPTDILVEIEVTNAGPEADTLHVLPTAWFRNTWSWDFDAEKPQMAATGAALQIDHPWLGSLELVAAAGPDGSAPQVLFCENETNVARLFAAEPNTPYPKDGINDHVVHGAATVNPDQVGTKASFWYRVDCSARRDREAQAAPAAQEGSPALCRQAPRLGLRRRRCDEAREKPTSSIRARRPGVPGRRGVGDAPGFRRDAVEQAVLLLRRRPLAGGRSHAAATPAGRADARNSRWRHFQAFDIMSMPDKWEYPWFAAWDLAFHCISLAHVDPAFAKYQLILVLPGMVPAPQWGASRLRVGLRSLNPPVQAWAALEVFATDGGKDLDFLSRILDKLMVNFTWWVNREDADGRTCSRAASSALTTSAPSTDRIFPSEVSSNRLMRRGDRLLRFIAPQVSPRSSTVHVTGRRPTW